MEPTRHFTLKFTLLVALLIIASDLCIEYVEGRINDENIVTSQRVTNCIGGIPACRKNVCRCLLIPPIGQFNNVPSPLPTIAN
ncbi:hypothetical protein P8452_07558 [Trifolium repens]|nr:hypothetical protein P8452_07558 [Trifolium repens]